jgi:hypothetical protein
MVNFQITLHSVGFLNHKYAGVVENFVATSVLSIFNFPRQLEPLRPPRGREIDKIRSSRQGRHLADAKDSFASNFFFEELQEF